MLWVYYFRVGLLGDYIICCLCFLRFLPCFASQATGVSTVGPAYVRSTECTGAGMRTTRNSPDLLTMGDCAREPSVSRALASLVLAIAKGFDLILRTTGLDVGMRLLRGLRGLETGPHSSSSQRLHQMPSHPIMPSIENRETSGSEFPLFPTTFNIDDDNDNNTSSSLLTSILYNKFSPFSRTATEESS